MIDYEKIKNAFSTNADNYRYLSITQDKVKKQLISEMLKQNSSNSKSNLLNIGIRDISEPLELMKEFNVSFIDAIDLSLKDISSPNNRIKLYELNFDKELTKLNNKYDMVFSNMSFQWSYDINALFRNINMLMSNDAIFGFSMPLNENFKEISNIFRTNNMPTKDYVVNSLYKEFGVDIDCSELYFTHEFKNIKELVGYLRKSGVNTYTGIVVNFSRQFLVNK